MCGTARQATGGNIMGRMRFSCRINKAQIGKHVIYNTYCLYSRTVVTLTRLDIAFYVYCPYSYYRGGLLRCLC